MAETKINVTADVSQAVRSIKTLIKHLRVINRELKTLESYCGTMIAHGSR
jgi:hypothetical protein